MMRLEMIQNSMSLLPTARRVRPTSHHGDDHAEQKQQEQRHRGEFHPKADAHQCIGCERADQQRQRRAGQRHHHGIQVGAERIVLDQHEVPGVEIGPEVDERDVERTVVDIAGALERGDQHPIERHQHHQRPQQQQRVGEPLGGRRLLLDRSRLEQAAENGLLAHVSNRLAGRTTKLKKETQTTVEMKRSV
jgi:hypothetical protein